jgi:heme A synthase
MFELKPYIPIIKGFLRELGYDLTSLTDEEVIILFYVVEVNPNSSDSKSAALIGLAVVGVQSFFGWLTSKETTAQNADQLLLQQQALEVKYQLEAQKFNGFLILALALVAIYIIVKT